MAENNIASRIIAGKRKKIIFILSLYSRVTVMTHARFLDGNVMTFTNIISAIDTNSIAIIRKNGVEVKISKGTKFLIDARRRKGKRCRIRKGSN